MYEKYILQSEADRCLLCMNAPCTSACTNGLDPAKLLRSVRFKNPAAESIDANICKSCAGACENACVLPESKIRIKRAAECAEKAKKTDENVNLSVEFCGVKCENPFFLSSSCVAGDYEMCARALKAGWGGIVYKTIGFVIPNEVSPRFDAINKETAQFVGFKNLEQISDKPLAENLAAIKNLKKEFPEKVIISSIMGSDEDEWTQLAKLSEDAGADIIECNFSCPQMVGEGMGSDVGTNPELVEKYTDAVRRGTKLPILAKMTPNITDMTIPAIAAVNAKADGIAAINTIKCLTGIDLDEMCAKPSISGKCAVSGYSGKAVKPVALRFISDLAGCRELFGVPLSGIGGIENWQDALEFIALGCSNIQMTTAVMQYGYRIIEDMLDGTRRFLSEHGFKSLKEIIGLASRNIVSADELDRETAEFPVFNREQCLGCGRCVISCADGGHKALVLDENRKPKMNGKCVGCGLCRLVCPVNAIGRSKRTPKKQQY